MVGAAGSSPTIRAEVLAVPISFKVVAVIWTSPSVALVIVSPLSKVIEVVEATPPSWIMPSVALLMISPLSKCQNGGGSAGKESAKAGKG